MERKVYEGAEVVVVLAKGVSDYVIKKGAKETIWLPNGPDLKLFRKIPLMPEGKMFSFKRPFNLLYAGAHGDANNLTNIIKAARILCDYPIKFVFVGNGPEKNNLIEQSKKFNNVFFEEPVPKSEMPNLISKFDAISFNLYAQFTQFFTDWVSNDDNPLTATIASPTVLIFSKLNSKKAFSNNLIIFGIKYRARKNDDKP